MPRIARLGDRTTCPIGGHVGGVIVTGSPNIRVNGRPLARVGDKIQCGCGTTDEIKDGASEVRGNGQKFARLGSPTMHGGRIVGGSGDAYAGDGGGGSAQSRALMAAARAAQPYAPRCPGGAAR